MSLEVTWTESAANQAKVILASEEEGLQVRCFIQGGGCSGFQYGFTLDKQNEDDMYLRPMVLNFS